MGCSIQAIIGFLMTLLVLLGVGVQAPVQPAAPPEPCRATAGEDAVPVHVGPGPTRAVRLYLPTSDRFAVIGQATATDKSLWWQLRVPNVEQAWVAQEAVRTSGACERVPTIGAPPVIAAPPQPSNSGDSPSDESSGSENVSQPAGGWGACGSCADCGPYPATECVLSPDNQCIWDPARCQQSSAPTGAADPNCVPETGGGGGTRVFCSVYGEADKPWPDDNPFYNCQDSCGNPMPKPPPPPPPPGPD